MNIGDTVRYIKTHEGHLCTITGLIHNYKNELVKVAVHCHCGSELFLNPKDIKQV